MFEGVDVKCCGGSGAADDGQALCACGAEERVLRGYIRADPELAPMSPVQRAWCLLEISSVEGYERKDYETASDSHLASGVLSAWLDFCRDKGML